MSNEISTKQFLSEFSKEIDKLGGPSNAAEHFEVSESFVRGVKNATFLPGRKILEKMKLKPVKQVKYRYQRLNPKVDK